MADLCNHFQPLGVHKLGFTFTRPIPIQIYNIIMIFSPICLHYLYWPSLPGSFLKIEFPLLYMILPDFVSPVVCLFFEDKALDVLFGKFCGPESVNGSFR